MEERGGVTEGERESKRWTQSDITGRGKRGDERNPVKEKGEQQKGWMR